MTIIYALLCPASGDVRYVGKTAMALARRLASHIMGCSAGRDKRQAKNVWLQEILSADLIPAIKILERVEDGECWEAAERKWIAHYRTLLGSELLNASDGGRGPKGYIPSAETRKKISDAGKARSPYPRSPPSKETRAKISAALKGRQGPMVGKKHSPESRAKMAASHKGKKLSEAHREKLSEVRKGRQFSAETRAKIGAKVSAAAAIKRAEKLASEQV